jgi:uncharacterized surface protein with fasciclin (FAS1) repeats
MVSVLFLSLVTTTKAASPRPTIVDIAVSNPDINNDGEGDFDILVAAVLAADPAVLSTLSGKGQFTVFAPTDDAFALAFAELGVTPQEVLANSEFLTDVLLYHVARGRLNANAVLNSDRIRTLQGNFLLQDSGILTDTVGRQANIIVTNIRASNGIIHVIDAVVLPYAP